jgi:spore coat protein SA
MASGTPVIASRIGGIPEIVKHGRNGLLVDRFRSPEAFASAILRLARKPGLARRLAKQGRKDVLNQFSWKATASRLVDIYRNK